MTETISQLKKEATASKDWLIRRRALIQLSHKKEPSLYSTFVKGLVDPVSEVRHAAVIALSRLGDRRAVGYLSKPRFLQAGDSNVRWMTVRALGVLGDVQIIDALIPLVDDEEWLVRNEAVSALKAKVEEIVHSADSSQARILVRMLSIPEPGIYDIAIEGLVSMEASCRQLLLDSLKSVKDVVRKGVVQVLGLAGDKEAVPALIRVLDDENPLVRAGAVKALAEIGDEQAIPFIVNRLRERNDHVREEIIKALVRFGSQVVQPLHSELMHAKEKTLISTIVLALGKIRNPQSIPLLISRLSSGFYSVRKDAVEALSSYGPQIVQPLLQKLAVNTFDINSILKDAHTQNGNVANRIRAIKALGDLEDHRAIELLKELVTVSDHLVAAAAEDALVKVGCAAWGRCGALMVIGKVGDESIVPQLVPSLKDDSPHVRYEVMRAFGKLKSKQAVPEIEKYVHKEKVPEVKSEALRVLRELSPGSGKLFNLALSSINDPSTMIRLVATRILGDFVDDRALSYLFEKVSDTSWSVRMSAENALCNYGVKVVPELVKRLKLEKVESRCRMISALARIGDTQAIEPLERFRDEYEHKDERLAQIAREALAILKGETGRKSVQLTVPLC